MEYENPVNLTCVEFKIQKKRIFNYLTKVFTWNKNLLLYRGHCQ